MKKALKYFLYAATTLFFLLLVGVVVIFRSLPSPSQIASVVQSAGPKPPNSSPSNQKSESPTPASSHPAEKSVASQDQLNERQLSESATPSKEDRMADFLLDPETPMLSICENLYRASNSKITGGKPDIFAVLDEAVQNDVDDPLSNAIAMPLRYIVRLPKIQEFLTEANNRDPNLPEENLVEKVAFYKTALEALQELQLSEKKINDIGKYAYQLFVISQVVKENPNLARDPSLREFCNQNQMAVAEAREFDSEVAAEQMKKFLEFANVAPESIGYEPEINSEFNFQITGNSLQIGLGWINKLINPPVKTATPPSSDTNL